MQSKLKLLIVVVLACNGLLHVLKAQTIQVISFDDLINVLNKGEQVRCVIHYAQCKLTIGGEIQPKSLDAVSGIEIGTYEYFAEGAFPGSPAFLVFSASELISNPHGKGYVINYGKVKVMAGNKVKITAQYIHPKTNKVLMDETFEGAINDGRNSEGIYFYSQLVPSVH